MSANHIDGLGPPYAGPAPVGEDDALTTSPFLTIDETAKLFRVSRETVRRMVHQGRLAAIVFGSGTQAKIRVPRAFVERVRAEAEAGRTVVVARYAESLRESSPAPPKQATHSTGQLMSLPSPGASRTGADSANSQQVSPGEINHDRFQRAPQRPPFDQTTPPPSGVGPPVGRVAGGGGC